MKLFTFSLLFVSLSSFAQTKHFVVMGGGGEPVKTPEGAPNTTTIFDTSLRSLGLFSKTDPKMQSRLIFNGGHTTTEQIARESFGSFNDRTQKFTKESYEAMISEYERKINSGEIKPGDQLMVTVLTHGGVKDKNEGTHSISTGEQALQNLNTLGGSTVSLDRLKKLSQLAQQRGIKLAIVDLSCHSGSTLALANDNTCVISASGPNHYGYIGGPSFIDMFNASLQKGKNLEEIYLSARARSNEDSFPMISSPEGKDVQDRLYKDITPYLYKYDPAADKQTQYLEEEMESGRYCQADDGFINLIAQAESIMSAAGRVNTQQVSSDFRTAIKNYHDYLSKLRTKMEKAGFGQMNKSQSFCSEYTAKKKPNKVCVNYTLKNLMTLNFDNIMSYFKSQAAAATGDNKSELNAYIENLHKARAFREKLLKENPQFKEYANFWASLPEREMITTALSKEVSLAQRKLYDVMYSQSKARGPNPCRDFVL